MKQDQTGIFPPHMWRSEFHPTSATHRRPRGAVTPGQLWAWIIALAVVLAIIIAIVWLVLPDSQAQTEGDAPTTTQMADSRDGATADDAAAATDGADTSTSN